MEALIIDAKTRTVAGKQVKQLRSTGVVPAVVYGHGVENRSIQLDRKAFDKLFAKAGESSLVDLSIDDGAPVKVLVHDVQRDPLRDETIHVDLRQVNMSEELEADVAFKFVGESPAVKALGGVLVRNLDAITVRCLPSDLVHEIEIDLSVLKNIEDSITVAELPALKGITYLAEPTEAIVIISAPISEEELAALDTKVEADVTAVKSSTEEKKAERAAAKETVEKK
jgi:large subunit ribosomal protein L25